jgi:hypothetical protein
MCRLVPSLTRTFVGREDAGDHLEHLQQQQMLLRSKLDRVYEGRLSDAIPEKL